MSFSLRSEPVGRQSIIHIAAAIQDLKKENSETFHNVVDILGYHLMKCLNPSYSLK